MALVYSWFTFVYSMLIRSTRLCLIDSLADEEQPQRMQQSSENEASEFRPSDIFRLEISVVQKPDSKPTDRSC
jgi:cytochrome c biogenesis protein ResB